MRARTGLKSRRRGTISTVSISQQRGCTTLTSTTTTARTSHCPAHEVVLLYHHFLNLSLVWCALCQVATLYLVGPSPSITLLVLNLAQSDAYHRVLAWYFTPVLFGTCALHLVGPLILSFSCLHFVSLLLQVQFSLPGTP